MDLTTGHDDSAVGLRFGLSDAEIIFSSNIGEAGKNELAFKQGYDPINTPYGIWSVASYGSVSYLEKESARAESAYSLGAIFTLENRQSLFTLNVKAESQDFDDVQKELISIGVGAYQSFHSTQYGYLEPGIELRYDDLNEALEYSLGLRWAMRNNATIDFTFLEGTAKSMNDTTDVVHVPGTIRVSYTL